jgi:hypothetical protein
VVTAFIVTRLKPAPPGPAGGGGHGAATGANAGAR